MTFIEEIAGYVQKYAPQYGVKVCSPIIAQACKESAFGGSELAINAKNIFGIKYKANRTPIAIGGYNKDTKEEYTIGQISTINACFARFRNWEECVVGYFQFITSSSRYSNLLGVTDYETYCRLIKQDGYATGSNYDMSLINDYIKKYNLTQYDDNIPSIKTTSFDGKCNMTACDNRKIEYIVVHYTANTTSKAGTALNNANYFNKEATKASADYIVDDAEIVQYNTKPLSQYCWACGNKDMNSKSISVELCSNKKDTSSKKASDTDWYFTSETLANGYNLIKFLMEFWGIDIDHVIRHYDVNGKCCPNPFCVNDKAKEDWNNFKKLLSGSNIEPENVQYYRVQLGAYKNKANAEALAKELKEKGYNAIIKYY